MELFVPTVANVQTVKTFHSTRRKRSERWCIITSKVTAHHLHRHLDYVQNEFEFGGILDDKKYAEAYFYVWLKDI